jgi:hypothetical protein
VASSISSEQSVVTLVALEIPVALSAGLVSYGIEPLFFAPVQAVSSNTP